MAARDGFPVKRLALLLASIAVVLLIALPFSEKAVHHFTRQPGGVAWEQKSVSLPVWSRDGFFDTGPALEQAKANGATSVTLVVTWYTPNVRSAEVNRTTRTASDVSLAWAISHARTLGLAVTLKPHLDSEDGQWRAYINPADADAWFANYTAMINRYAEMAQRNDVSLLSIGSELISMSTNPAYEKRWRELIAGVRERFEGKLTYSANWGGGYFADANFAHEFERMSFWDALDYLGISAYFELSRRDDPTVPELVASWSRWRESTIQPFHRRWGKPVLFTEIGYRSVDGAARMPWAATEALPLDVQEQQDCLEAFFTSWARVPWFAGASLWMWGVNTESSPEDAGYLIQNKPAQDTVHRWYAGSSASGVQPSVAGSRIRPAREGHGAEFKRQPKGIAVDQHVSGRD